MVWRLPSWAVRGLLRGRGIDERYAVQGAGCREQGCEEGCGCRWSSQSCQVLTCAEKCTAWTVCCVWRGVILVWSVRCRSFLLEWGIWWRADKAGACECVLRMACRGQQSREPILCWQGTCEGLSGRACSQFCERCCRWMHE